MPNPQAQTPENEQPADDLRSALEAAIEQEEAAPGGRNPTYSPPKISGWLRAAPGGIGACLRLRHWDPLPQVALQLLQDSQSSTLQ